jgi:hypothetical protein
VRADGGGTSKLFNSTVDQTQPAYDAGGSGGTPDGQVWVRAVGVANCRTVAVISKVAVQYVPLTFPQNAVTANAFATSNSGNKAIVNTLGVAPQAGQIAVRCTGLTPGPPWPGSQCTNYRSGQVSPDTVGSAASSSSTTLNALQLSSLKLQAQNNGTYWGPGGLPGCPSSPSQLTGNPTYIEGPCYMNFTTGGTGNSVSSPGFLVMANGSLQLNGPITFYGVIYGVNTQGATGLPCSGQNAGGTSPSDIVYVHGTALVQGAIDVDGNGTVCFGSSAQNFAYDNTAFATIKGFGGAVSAPNTFRVLPDGQ